MLIILHLILSFYFFPRKLRLWPIIFSILSCYCWTTSSFFKKCCFVRYIHAAVGQHLLLKNNQYSCDLTPSAVLSCHSRPSFKNSKCPCQLPHAFCRCQISQLLKQPTNSMLLNFFNIVVADWSLIVGVLVNGLILCAQKKVVLFHRQKYFWLFFLKEKNMTYRVSSGAMPQHKP